MKTKIKQSWIVTVECTVTKELVCERCTEEQANESPFIHSISERELGMSDWDVKRVEPNT